MEILTEARPRNLLFHVRELADLYALKTLYDYTCDKRIAGNGLEAKVFFGGSIDSERSREVLQDAPRKDQFQHGNIDAVVSCFSDIGGGGDVEIDISLLKNSVFPMSAEEKAKLRQKYGVPSLAPVLVVGYALPSREVVKVAEAASERATVYLVGSGNKEDYKLSPGAKSKVHVVTNHGILKDFYAMADFAVNADNLRRSSSPLHNFVEATEGGRLFMVPSTNLAQYGYRQLVDAGVIVESMDFMGLVGGIEQSLRDFKDNLGVSDARARHLMKTREQYLPVILAKIMQHAGEELIVPPSDLVITPTPNGVGTKIMHPNSDWGVMSKNPISIGPDSFIKYITLDSPNRYLSYLKGDQYKNPKSMGTNESYYGESLKKYFGLQNLNNGIFFSQLDKKNITLPQIKKGYYDEKYY